MPFSRASKLLFSVAILFLLGIMPLTAAAGVQVCPDNGPGDSSSWVLAMLAEKETDPESEVEDPQDPPKPYDLAGFDDYAALWHFYALHAPLMLHGYDSRLYQQIASLAPVPTHRPPIA